MESTGSGPVPGTGLRPGRQLAEKHSRRQGQRDATRRRITQAALETFEEVGFQAATIEAISKRAGIGRTTFYLHFQTKADLANEIGLDLFPSARQLFLEMGALDADDRLAICAWLERYRAFVRAHQFIMIIATQANMSDVSLAGDLMTLWEEFADGILGSRGGSLDDRRSRLETLRMMMMSLDRFAYICDTQGVDAPRRLVDAMCSLIQSSLKSALDPGSPPPRPRLAGAGPSGRSV